MRANRRKNRGRLLTLSLSFFCGMLSLSAARNGITVSAEALDFQNVETQPNAFNGFEPLERWRLAVLAGNKTALAEFYASTPSAIARTPNGIQKNPAVEEPEFWSSLFAQGLVTVVSKVLDQTSPQGSTRLVLRIELTFRVQKKDVRRVVSAVQIWVKRAGLWQIQNTQRGALEDAAAYRLPEPVIPNPQLYPDPGRAQQDFQAAITAAQANGKRVLVIFGANWCYDCHVLDAALRSNGIAALVALNFQVVHVNVENGESNAELADRCGTSAERGIPSLVVLASDGLVISSGAAENYPLVAKTGAGDLIKFLNRWKDSTGLQPN
jgi:thioredoxin 1